MDAGGVGGIRCAKHHVIEPHNEMFPEVKASPLDLVELGGRMAAREDERLAQASGTP
jgi:hypothetical protein